MTLKVWKEAEQLEFPASYNISDGSGNFDGLFSVISSITLESLEEVCEMMILR